MRGFAVCVGSNTHTAPNYRLPPSATTHDPECSNKYCREVMAREQTTTRRECLLHLSKAISRASREMSGYYMGYTFKGQPVGKKALKLVDKSFEYLGRSLNAVESHKRFRHTAIRTMITYHHSTTSRPTTEEALLSMYVNDNDVTNAEFNRLYVNKEFDGSCLLRALESAQTCNPRAKREEQQKTLPKIKKYVEEQSIMLLNVDALYGWRPKDDAIFYLNAWEFLMWWQVMRKATFRGCLLYTSPSPRD